MRIGKFVPACRYPAFMSLATGGPSSLVVARVAHAQWFFVNLYEAVVRMPDRLADGHDGRTSGSGPFASGSPARYHLPAVPVVLGSTVAALVRARRDEDNRAALVLAATCSLSAFGLTGYLVRRVNLRLLDGGAPLKAGERHALVNRWYRVNRVRLALLAVGSIAYECAAQRRRAG